MNTKEQALDITWASIGKVALAIALFYGVFLTRDIFIWMLFGVMLSILFEPAISFIARFGIPRGIAVVIVYLGACIIVALTLYGMSPFFVNEIRKFSELLPQYLQTAAPPLRGFGTQVFLSMQDVLVKFGDQAQNIASNMLAGLFAVLGGIFSAVFVLSIAIFLSMEERSVERFISFFFPKKHEATGLALWKRAQKKVSGWFVSRVLSSLFVGGLMFVALFLFGVRYPFSLSLLSGVLNFIPVVGPLVATFFLGVVVAFDSVAKALFVLLAFVVVQQIENNILTPILTKRFVGLHPVLVLAALTIGGQLWGILGAILAVPLTGILFEFLHDFLERRRKEELET